MLIVHFVIFSHVYFLFFKNVKFSFNSFIHRMETVKVNSWGTNQMYIQQMKQENWDWIAVLLITYHMFNVTDAKIVGLEVLECAYH